MGSHALIARLLAIFILCLLLPARPTLAAETSATGVVEGFQQMLLSVMKNAKDLGYQGRYERLAPAVTASHDLPFIVMTAVGRYWGKLDDRQKSLLVDTFTKLSIATYAARFDGYGGETFKVVAEKPRPRDNVLVQSLLIDPDGEQTHFDYQLRKKGNQWQIINIIVDGVSDLALKRAEYTSIIKNQGFTALVDKLKEQIAQYAKGEKDE